MIHFLCRTLNHETRLYRHPVNTAKFLWPVVGRINHIPPGGGGGVVESARADFNFEELP